MKNVLRFDYNGSPHEFTRTPQGFLRVKARLSKAGIFSYNNSKEYRSEAEIFREDSLASIKGAPVTNRHPSEQGGEQFLTPANARQHIIGLTESVERDGPYLKGSLIIFHEDAISAIERGECKEISLGYQCQVEPIPGNINGEPYDAVQKNIIVNHVAIGPKGWGRAGSDCAIKSDSKISKEVNMSQITNLDSPNLLLKPQTTATPILEHENQLQVLQGRLDAMSQELERERSQAFKNLSKQAAQVRSLANLYLKCRDILGDEIKLDGKSEQELKIEAIKKFYPSADLVGKEPAHIDGMFEVICGMDTQRNDSLSQTRSAIEQTNIAPVKAYEQWLVSTTQRWKKPLSGHL